MNPGIHKNIPEKDYFALKYASKTSLGYLMKSPRHLRLYLDGHAPSGKSEAFDFGRAVDTFITAPAEFDERIAIRPKCDRRNKAGQAIYEAFLATNGDKAEIKTEQAACLPGIKTALMSHPLASRLLTPRAEVEGKQTGDGLHDVQVSIVAEIEGVMCRARLDGWNVIDGVSTIFDLKTTADIDGIERDAVKYHYILQAAIYSMMMEELDKQAGREPRYRPFVFLFVQSTPDEVTGEHPVDTLNFDGADVEFAKGEIRKWLRLWKKCEEANDWPKPSPKTKTVKLSPWQLDAIRAPVEEQP